MITFILILLWTCLGFNLFQVIIEIEQIDMENICIGLPIVILCGPLVWLISIVALVFTFKEEVPPEINLDIDYDEDYDCQCDDEH